MLRSVLVFCALACCSGAISPAQAGTLAFAVDPARCSGTGLCGFTGLIEGVGSDGTFTPTNVVITGYDLTAFSTYGGATPTPPISTSTWDPLSAPNSLSGDGADMVTMSGGVAQSLDIELMDPSSPFASMTLYLDSTQEDLALQLDAVAFPTFAGSISSSISPSQPLVNYTYEAEPVPEPWSAFLFGFALLATLGLRPRRA